MLRVNISFGGSILCFRKFMQPESIFSIFRSFAKFQIWCQRYQRYDTFKNHFPKILDNGHGTLHIQGSFSRDSQTLASDTAKISHVIVDHAYVLTTFKCAGNYTLRNCTFCSQGKVVSYDSHNKYRVLPETFTDRSL